MVKTIYLVFIYFKLLEDKEGILKPMSNIVIWGIIEYSQFILKGRE